MRLVSYNILDGGEGRADPLAEVIQAQRPDIVCLVEAEFPPVLERIRGRLAMDVVQADGNQASAVALLSRWPIRESINHGPRYPQLSKALLEAVVVDPAGGEWTVGVLHLHAHAAEEDERRREEEIAAAVLEAFAPHRRAGRPHLLCGDFNAVSPVQQLDPTKVKPSTREAMARNGGDVPRRVVRRLLDAGYVDTLHAKLGAAAATVGTFSTQHPGQRVDYVFAFGIDPRRIAAAWVEQDRLAKYASDHFPVGVEITG